MIPRTAVGIQGEVVKAELTRLSVCSYTTKQWSRLSIGANQILTLTSGLQQPGTSEESFSYTLRA